MFWKKPLNKFQKMLIVPTIAVGVLLVLSIINDLNGPMAWKMEELTATEEGTALTGLELTLDLASDPRRITVSNDSDCTLEGDASVDVMQNLVFHPAIEVMVDGVWYEIPYKEINTSGVGVELVPGAVTEGEFSHAHHNRLPNGRYRAAIRLQEAGKDTKYTAYAEFEVNDDVYTAVQN